MVSKVNGQRGSEARHARGQRSWSGRSRGSSGSGLAHGGDHTGGVVRGKG